MSQPEASTLTLRHRSATYDEAKLRGVGTFALKQMGVAFSIDMGEHGSHQDGPQKERRLISRELTLRIVGRPELLCNAEGAAMAVRLTFQARLSAVYTPEV
jgi:hypothetical protein